MVLSVCLEKPAYFKDSVGEAVVRRSWLPRFGFLVRSPQHGLGFRV